METKLLSGLLVIVTLITLVISYGILNLRFIYALTFIALLIIAISSYFKGSLKPLNYSILIYALANTVLFLYIYIFNKFNIYGTCSASFGGCLASGLLIRFMAIAQLPFLISALLPIVPKKYRNTILVVLILSGVLSVLTISKVMNSLNL